MTRLPAQRRQLGVVTRGFCKLAARVTGVPEVHLFTTLGQHPRLFFSWLAFAGVLLGLGKLPRQDTELVILRVGHLRGSEYELQQHRRIARRRGIDPGTQAKIFEGPQAAGLTDRQRLLLTAVDELISSRTLSDRTRAHLQDRLGQPQLIEFCMLCAQYDGLAATISALRVPLDYPQ